MLLSCLLKLRQSKNIVLAEYNQVMKWSACINNNITWLCSKKRNTSLYYKFTLIERNLNYILRLQVENNKSSHMMRKL